MRGCDLNCLLFISKSPDQGLKIRQSQLIGRIASQFASWTGRFCLWKLDNIVDLSAFSLPPLSPQVSQRGSRLFPRLPSASSLHDRQEGCWRLTTCVPELELLGMRRQRSQDPRDAPRWVWMMGGCASQAEEPPYWASGRVSRLEYYNIQERMTFLEREGDASFMVVKWTMGEALSTKVEGLLSSSYTWDGIFAKK